MDSANAQRRLAPACVLGTTARHVSTVTARRKLRLVRLTLASDGAMKRDTVQDAIVLDGIAHYGVLVLDYGITTEGHAAHS